MNVAYLHGFASFWNPASDKARSLSVMGSVSGFDVDYTAGAGAVIEHALTQLDVLQPDVLVGCSMGGWLAAVLSERCDIPFVALNPAVDPVHTLNRYIGSGLDYRGKRYCLSGDTVDTFFPMPERARGLIFLDAEDEVLDSDVTLNAFRAHYPCYMYPGGDHRFQHLDLAVPVISRWLASGKSEM
jgi:uncharacterized protein